MTFHRNFDYDILTHSQEIEESTRKSNRRVRLKHFFRNQPASEPQPFRKASGWTPPSGIDSHLDTFLNIITETIKTEVAPRKVKNNLTKQERLALESLMNNVEIIIKPADKGGAVVVMDKTDYINEAHRQLYNPANYRRLKKDQNPEIVKKVNQFLKFVRERNLLDPEITQYLTPKNPRTPIFYLLPKIHKPGNPGRPIISQEGSCTEKLSAFVDHHLKQLATQTTSYIKDTTDFLRKIKELGPIPPGSLLCTADVSSLYTSIPHQDGIRAAKIALDNRTNPTPSTWIILRMIAIILTNNCFRFDREFFLQIQGTAMGTKMAPNYAIIFMDHLEQRFLSTLMRAPIVWWRYIDDIFFIWPHTREELTSFLEALNAYHPTIKFTSEISDTSVDFLDTTIYSTEDGTLSSKIHNKPTNAFQYLHYKSCHPKHQRDNIPYAQALRVRKICDNDIDFKNECIKLKDRFVRRDYPEQLIDNAIARVSQVNRDSLFKKQQNTETQPAIAFVLTYNPQNPPIGKIIKNYEHILRYNPDTQKILDQARILVAHTKPKSIRNYLVHSDIARELKPAGNKPCGKNCRICVYMCNTEHVKSSSNNRSHKITKYIDCQSINAIYLITCKKCNIQYVGQTSNTINIRIRNHLYDIYRRDESKPVAAHFSSPGHNADDVTVTGYQ
ncbi:uncharacterized protein LOC132553191 [Ylistrum balloti]|uniref:uncharacterized protein LOC132553191 n=1 Tax=Ylistrum balloti TaxID=509963 RepID=UPI002905DD1D|nr:uncharacterized protein LOC132553191 [Ylistrum balloti]